MKLRFTNEREHIVLWSISKYNFSVFSSTYLSFPFLLTHEQNYIVQKHHIFFIHSSADRIKGNNIYSLLWTEQPWTWLYKYLCGRTWDILSTYPGVGVAGLYDCFITELLRIFQTTFQRGCIGLLFHQPNKRVSFPHTDFRIGCHLYVCWCPFWL